MAVSASEFLRKGVGKTPSRIYLLHGKEEGQKRAVLQRLRDELVVDEFDRAHLDMQEIDLPTLLAEAMSIPAFSPRRVVMVRGVQHLKSAEIDTLLDFLPRLPDTTCLILYTHAESDEEERKGGTIPTKLLQAVERLGTVIECKPLTASAFDSWLSAQLQAVGKQMTPDAQERFTFLTAASPAAAEAELQKLLLYTGERATIERADVEAVVSRTVEAQVFRLVDAIVQRDAAQAMRLLHDVLTAEGRAEAVVPRLMVLIARQLRLLWQMRLLLELGESANEWFPTDPNLTELLRRQPYLKRSLSEQASRLSLADLQRAFERLHQADRELKGIESGESDPRRVLERLVVELCVGE
ncbi:MAG: DNA polymerase III subunit delta [Armatimonadetes bacterium]|nr:DNA polymerase III subunit delta [Armatimonadota bacterium]